jgi:uncharacterized membrane protein (UPF0127 family)
MSRRKIALLSVAIAYLLSSLSAGGEKPSARLTFPSGKEIVAELARTDEERARGLMFRERLLPDEGMLFIFDQPDFYPFWMKNMSFPIDIIWLSPEAKIVYIASQVPPCKKEPCPSYQPYSKALYVIEVSAGFARKEKLKVGDRVEIVFLSPE